METAAAAPVVGTPAVKYLLNEAGFDTEALQNAIIEEGFSELTDFTKYSTFTLAANALSEAISKAFPALPYSKFRRSIGEIRVSQSRNIRSRPGCVSGQGNNLCGTYDGRYGGGNNQRSKNTVNGVDISDPTRRFSHNE